MGQQQRDQTMQMIQDALGAGNLATWDTQQAQAPVGSSGSSYTPTGLQTEALNGPLASSTGLDGVHPTLSTAIRRLIADSGGKITIKSGHRDSAQQAALYAKAVREHGADAGKWAAPPGHSNHEKGLAADLGFASPDTVKWAHDNAGKYGLNFPLSNENWHVEMAGTRK